MKISTNRKELIELDACSAGFDVFVCAHGDKDAKFSECLKSNGWDDTWWLITEVYSQLSIKQTIDLHLLGCDWAESVLCSFESEYPDDNRPRLAIEAKRRFLAGEITELELSYASSASWSAALSASWSAESSKSAASSAAWSASWSAESSKSAVWSTARAAASSARAAASSAQKDDLMDLFLSWEK